MLTGQVGPSTVLRHEEKLTFVEVGERVRPGAPDDCAAKYHGGVTCGGSRWPWQRPQKLPLGWLEKSKKFES